MADPEADWMLGDDAGDTANVTGGDAGDSGAVSSTDNSAGIPTGPPVPNPYAHILRVPKVERQYQHWARNKHLQYKYLNEYSTVYYDDCIDYLDKRRMGIDRDEPHPQEWGERVLRVYAKDGERLSGKDYKYWYTTANEMKPRPDVVHAVHSKGSILRQYKSIMC